MFSKKTRLKGLTFPVLGFMSVGHVFQNPLLKTSVFKYGKMSVNSFQLSSNLSQPVD